MQILSYITKTALLLWLWAAAELDLKYRHLNLVFLCISFTAGFALQSISGTLALWELLAGAGLGAGFALISKASREAIGYGDSFCIAVCGAWLGFYENIFLLMCSFLILAVFAMAALTLRKLKVKETLPFVPFLLAGYIALLAF